jgi:16S rRNA (guanine1207-N2)-methyltransferase
MIDLAVQWIQQQISSSDITENQLWLMDENHLHSFASKPAERKIQVISNRWDVAQQAIQKNYSTLFNDFDLSTIADDSLDAIFYRISKEKPLVHHVFNQSWRCLKPGGSIYLAGYKNEGIKTFVDKLAALLGDTQKAVKDGALYTAQLLKKNNYSQAGLDDQQYPLLRIHEINSHDKNAEKMLVPLKFFSKPGLFGWNKIDQGSELLIRHLHLLALAESTPQTCLDLGCGYGYITLAAAPNPICRPIKSWTLTDNNAAALLAAEKNLISAGLDGKVIAADCASEINETFDLILSNPPFHQGFTPDADLTEKFVKAASRLLSRQGIAFFVVNQFVPLETKASAYFSRISLLHKEAGFKLISLQR